MLPIFTSLGEAILEYPRSSEGPNGHRSLSIYVASSWRNPYQQDVVRELREMGHDPYDYRNPAPGQKGFAWSDCGAGDVSHIRNYVVAMRSERAAEGFALDKAAMERAELFVMVLPCGRSAHLEAGWAAGRGIPVLWWLHPDQWEPELMYLLADSYGSAFIVDRNLLTT